MAALMADGTGQTPAFFIGYAADPTTNTPVAELAFTLAELQVYFGFPMMAVGTTPPVDGTTTPVSLNANADNSNTFLYKDTTNNVDWTYDTADNVWHGETQVIVDVNTANATEFDVTTHPAGFTEANIVGVTVRRDNGTQELSVNTIDVSTAGTAKFIFQGIQTTASDHSLLIRYAR